MQWKDRFLAFVFLAVASGLFGQQAGIRSVAFSAGGAKPDQPASFMIKAMSAIEGRALTVRVYQNPTVDPEKYVKVSVPVRSGQLLLSAIKKAHPSASRLSYVFCLASDQKDKTVARALEGIVFLLPYSGQSWQPIPPNPEFADRQPNSYWTFLDAMGTPMTGASVEIRIINQSGKAHSLSSSDMFSLCSSSIYVGSGTLDDKGRLKRILAGAGELLLIVKHPRYGIASLLDSGSRNDTGDVCIVPLVQKDSPAAAKSIQGTVVDSDNRPVKSAAIRVVRTYLVTAGSAASINEAPSIALQQGFKELGVLTDEKGWFSFCEPSISRDLRYRLEIVPPKSLNLHQMGVSPSPLDQIEVRPGSRSTYTLMPINGAPSFHTFLFKHAFREITSADELNKIELTFERDGRQWIKLAYADFKDGFELPPGTLRAEIVQEGRSSDLFPAIEIYADGPRQRIIEMPAPIACRGKVIDKTTGKPLAGVYVTPIPVSGDPNSWTTLQWQEWRERAGQYAKDETLGHTLSNSYSDQNRVVLTNADGIYETRMPGTSGYIPNMLALAPGYAIGYALGADSPDTTRMLSIKASAGSAELPTIKMMPSESVYSPKFLFEDKNMQAIDRKQLTFIRIKYEIHSGGTVLTSETSFDRLLESKRIVPAIYSATAIWNDKYCEFMPEDLTYAKPETVVFQIREMWPRSISYKGQVIDGTTGAPIWGAIVRTASMRNMQTGSNGDGSQFEPQQWEALKTLDSADSKSSALAAFKTPGAQSLCGSTRCAVTDREGRFNIEADITTGMAAAFMKESRYGAIDILANGFICVQQALPTLSSVVGTSFEQLKSNQIDSVTLPTLQMFPAATIRFHMVIPDTKSAVAGRAEERGGMPSVRIEWEVASEDAWKLLPDIRSGVNSLKNITIGSPQYFRANIDQTAYIPAGVNLTLTMSPATPADSISSAVIGPMKIERGEVKTLGRISCRPISK